MAGTRLNRSRQQTLFIFTQGKAISICRLRVRARELIVGGAAFYGDMDTSAPSPRPLVPAGGGWRLEEGDSSGHERTSALEDD